jgi:hypothetical protein
VRRARTGTGAMAPAVEARVAENVTSDAA